MSGRYQSSRDNPVAEFVRIQPEGAPAQLAELQHWMQTAITQPGEDAIQIERRILPSSRLSAEERLAIYSHAYFARLGECLRESFPALADALGEETFESFVVEYLGQHPSQSYSLDFLGDRFAEFLQATRPDDGSTWPEFLIDLARLEQAIGEVFSGGGIEEKPWLSPESLREIPPDQWPDCRVMLAPCVRLLRFSFPINDYYTAWRRDESPAWPQPQASWLLLTRREWIVRRLELSSPQFALLEALRARQTVGEALQAAVAAAGKNDVATLASNVQRWFAEWSNAGIFTHVERPR